ncbi:hypothetical protein scyTo_0025020 [Scyliorhinus torazame]|uniref:SH3 domain-containing protein n=1 Tax=Scyliorhinus torazame TaxID=75743 RepID=A0A401QFR2_SCYTO|nr:hypothetical protein [Scyliorhinus torazame]
MLSPPHHSLRGPDLTEYEKSYVQPRGQHRGTSHERTQAATLLFQALYSYIPQNEDELELREGDIVDVLEKCDDGWFVGTYCIITTTEHLESEITGVLE